MNKIEACAMAAHEMNRTYCIAIGDNSQVPWDQAPENIRASAIDGVKGALAGATPEQSHENWCAFKVADGWVHGPAKDIAAKTHPCLVPYAALPPEQRRKDGIYIAAVRAMSEAIG